MKKGKESNEIEIEVESEDGMNDNNGKNNKNNKTEEEDESINSSEYSVHLSKQLLKNGGNDVCKWNLYLLLLLQMDRPKNPAPNIGALNMEIQRLKNNQKESIEKIINSNNNNNNNNNSNNNQQNIHTEDNPMFVGNQSNLNNNQNEQ